MTGTHTLLTGMSNGTADLENMLKVFLKKINIKLPYNRAPPLLVLSAPEKKKNILPHKDAYANAPNITRQTNPNQETI